MPTVDLKGLGVALITPFKEDNSIDFDALGRLVEYQLENGTDYLVALGTTAETPTLGQRKKQKWCVTSWNKQREGAGCNGSGWK